jgi:hypothetical protein
MENRLRIEQELEQKSNGKQAADRAKADFKSNRSTQAENRWENGAEIRY